MSFTPAGGGADRSFELVRQSLLQGDDLPFQEALTAAQMRQAFDAEGVSFGESAGGANVGGAGAGEADHDGLVYTMGVTLWAMLSQALFTDLQRACRAAVQRVAVYYALVGREVSSTSTGAYSRARAKVPEGWSGVWPKGWWNGARRPFPTRGGGTGSARWSSTARRSRCPTRKRTRRSIRSPPVRPRGWAFRSCGRSR